MKSTVLPLLIVLLLSVVTTNAQFRNQEANLFTNTGNVIKQDAEEVSQNGPSFRMFHSFESSVGTFGGNTFNQNMYTNTMMYQINPRLSARVDMSFAHSPMPNVLGQQQGPQFFIRNAELNYQLSKNSAIQVRFQQLPSNGFSPFGGQMMGNQPFSPFALPSSGDF